MAGTVQGGPSGSLQSQDSKAPVTPQSLPNKAPESNFIYFVMPSRWTVHEYTDGTQELLPTLSKLKLDPGVGGVSETGDYTLAKAKRMRNGEIEIPRIYGPDDYVKELRVRSGTLYHERWRSFVPNGSQIVERHTPEDHDAYLHWLHDVCAGKWPALPQGIPIPIPEVLEGQQEMLTAKLHRQIEQAATNPLKAGNAEATMAKIETIEEFKETLETGDLTIAPKPGKQTLSQRVKAAVSKKKVVTREAPDAEG